MTHHYRGRFAPSPTGDLHLGSLMVAMVSYLRARQAHGQWLIRIEDLDPPREVPGAATRILEALAAHGMTPDEAPWYQSRRGLEYQRAIRRLLAGGHAFACACTRAQLPATGLYPGTCRTGLPAGRPARAVRLRTPDRVIGFDDLLQGWFEQNLEQEAGDFVIRRADGLTAYQLAVVVDDAAQGITEIVRGADLLDSTPRQIYLQECLALPTPTYMHLPLLLGPDGRKLSKQCAADPIDIGVPLRGLRRVMALLGQAVPTHVDTVAGFWAWAIENWRLDCPRRQGLSINLPNPAAAE